MAERCKYEWIFSTEWLNGKFIYSCLCFGILKTAAPQRKSSRGYEKHLTVLIMHNMISESFNESLYSSQPNMQIASQVLYLLWAEQLVQWKMSGHTVCPPTLTAGRCLRLILKLLPQFLRAELQAWIFAILLIAMQCQWPGVSHYYVSFIVLTHRSMLKWRILVIPYWPLAAISDDLRQEKRSCEVDVWTLASADHSNFSKLH